MGTILYRFYLLTFCWKLLFINFKYKHNLINFQFILLISGYSIVPKSIYVLQ